MRVNLCLAAAVLLIANIASPVRAVPVLDQSNPLTNPLTDSTYNGSLNWEQGVTAGLTGQLTGVQLFLYQAPPSQAFSLEVKIALGTPFSLTSAFLFDQFTSTGFLDTSSAGIFLTAGDKFVIDTSNSTNGNGFNGPHQVYAGGDLWENTGGPPFFAFNFTALTGDTMGFKTFIDAAPNATPLPAALPLFATGLGALGLLGWRRKKKAALAA